MVESGGSTLPSASILLWLIPMPSSSSNLPDPTDASKPHAREEEVPKNLPSKHAQDLAVKTFEFEVTAGRPAQATEATSAPQPRATAALQADVQCGEGAESLGKGSLGKEAPTKKSSEQSLSVENIAPVIAEKPAPTAPELPSPIDVEPLQQAGEDVGVARRIARQSSWWITSLGAHLLLLVSLAFSTFVVLREEELELYVSPAVYETVEEFEDLEIDPAEELDLLAEELNMPDPGALADFESETLIKEPTLPISESTAEDVASNLAEFGQLFGDEGTGMSGLDNELGTGAGGAMAKFFGTEVQARRILYMLDNSGGMRKGGKFEALVSELQNSVSRLQPKQKFYVIFYSDTVYPLFFPYSVREFIKSTPKSQKKLGAWLDSVELCGGNAIDEALAAAEVIQPDAVFLLTDGKLYSTEKKRALLLNSTGRRYAIHTFGLGVKKDSRASEELKQVAEANAGTFRAIKVTDAMKTLAKEKQRPYHSKKPGPVWGLKVGSR